MIPTWLRILFLPIMLAAGIVTVLLMVSLTTPPALWHFFRNRRYRDSDRLRSRNWQAEFLRASGIN